MPLTITWHLDHAASKHGHSPYPEGIPYLIP